MEQQLQMDTGVAPFYEETKDGILNLSTERLYFTNLMAASTAELLTSHLLNWKLVALWIVTNVDTNSRQKDMRTLKSGDELGKEKRIILS